MSEDKKEAVQDNAQEVAPDSQSQEPETSPELGSAIAESKKYRNRAQEAETKLAKLEDERLAEQNKWKTLAEKRQAHIDSIETDYNRLKDAEEAYREELLNGLSDEDKKDFGDLSVIQLRNLTDKLNNETPNVAPTSGAPARSTNPTNKKWVEMSAEERRSNWTDILQGYVKG